MNRQFITPIEEPWQQETLVLGRIELHECRACGIITNQEFCSSCRQQLSHLLELRCPACGHPIQIEGKPS
jgi:predicted  nucleic acid-binding Zn-ribbon protein